MLFWIVLVSHHWLHHNIIAAGVGEYIVGERLTIVFSAAAKRELTIVKNLC